jgi:nitrogen fixation NifU-like protein
MTDVSDLRDLYQEIVLDHGKHPRNLRKPAEANRIGHGYNAMCGDKIDVYLTIGGDGRISDAAFQGHGCAISTASASIMTETLKGRTEAEAKSLYESVHALCTEDGAVLPDALMVLAGVRQYPMRVKCATLAWHTMQAAIEGQASEVST